MVSRRTSVQTLSETRRDVVRERMSVAAGSDSVLGPRIQRRVHDTPLSRPSLLRPKAVANCHKGDALRHSLTLRWDVRYKRQDARSDAFASRPNQERRRTDHDQWSKMDRALQTLYDLSDFGRSGASGRAGIAVRRGPRLQLPQPHLRLHQRGLS